jgi:hypothetical protein
MSRVVTRELYWDAPADTSVTGYAVYAGAPDLPDFLGNVDAGNVEPLGETADTSFTLGEGLLDDGNYQFCVCAKDGAGNFSDPYQHPAWASVPLDLTAPAAPTGGGIRVSTA